MADVKIGQEIGRYKIVDKLGRGGMAEVYKGYQESLDRYVAIKLMHAFLVSEQDFLLRFQREARAIAKLNHPNIVSVYDFDTLGDDVYYLVMQYIGGGTLKDKLQGLASQGERLSLDEAIRIATEITDALAYAHGQGMIHRDIKPANIMLTVSGKAVLTDFGIVKLVGGAQTAAFTATGALIGTPAYMAPEQAMGQPGDERSDIYSLGIMLFQMLTGKLPFDADTPLAVVMKHVNEAVPLPNSFNPDIPFRLQEVVLKALEKDPNRRFQSAGDMVAALQRAQMLGEGATALGAAGGWTQAGHTADYDTAAGYTSSSATAVVSLDNPSTRTAVADPATTTPVGAPAATSRSPWLYGGLGLLAVLIIAGIIWFSGRGGDNEIGPIATEPTVVEVAFGSGVTDEPTATATAATPTITATPMQTPDIAASLEAAIVLTTEAQPTDTPTPSRTATSAPTNTPDATGTFLASCVVDVELVEAHPYRSNGGNAAAVGVQFPMYWTLRNSGTCPWPADLQWQYVEGETFGDEGEPVTLELEADVLPEEEIEITTPFVSPSNVATFVSSWQLLLDEEPFGPVVDFEVRTYVPATATPVATAVPAATPTTEAEITELGYLSSVSTCEYQGGDWSCHVRITPFGGAGGPYSVFVFDQPAGQATRLSGPVPMSYFARSRRCANFNAAVRIVDDGVTPALEFSRNLFIDPDDYFEGGCVE